jgi:competence protein ComEC
MPPSTVPLLWVALALAAGILLADRWQAGPAPALVTALILLAARAWLVVDKRRRFQLLLGAVLAAGAGLHAWNMGAALGHPLRELADEHQQGAGRGGMWIETGGAVRRLRTLDVNRVEALVEVREIQSDEGALVFARPALVRVLATAITGEPGSGWLRISGTLRPLAGRRNPGEFDGRDFWLRQGVVAEAQARAEWAPKSEARAPATARWLLAMGVAADRARQRVKESLSAGREAGSPGTAVLTSIVLGASEDTDPRVEDAFRRSGTLHVFAVSGLHVGLVAGVFWWLLRPLRLPRHRAVLLLVPLVLAYAWITGWRPSATRAALMISLVMGMGLLQRRPSLMNHIGAAALLLLVWDTQSLFHTGFQLSFGVLLAIAFCFGPILNRLEPWAAADPFVPRPLLSWGQRAGSAARLWLAELLAVSVSAWLGSAPLMLWHFHSVTPVGVLANLLLVPMAFACLAAACAGALPGLLLPSLAITPLTGLAAGIAAWMAGAASFFAALPGAHWHAGGLLQAARPDFSMRVLAFNRGQEAALLRVDGRQWLLDTAHARDFNPVLHPALRRAGVNRLEGLVLSHADASHAGGAADLLRLIPVSRLYVPPHEPWRQESRLSTMRRLLEEEIPLLHPGLPVRPVGAGTVLALGAGSSPARLTVLHPGPGDRHPAADDRCMVILIEFGKLRILSMADAGFRAETALLRRGENLRCHILICGAHGSDLHLTGAFLQAVSPMLVIDCGSDREAGSTHSSLGPFAGRQGVPVWQPALSGAVDIVMTTDEVDHAMVTAFATGERLSIPLAEDIPPPQPGNSR